MKKHRQSNTSLWRAVLLAVAFGLSGLATQAQAQIPYYSSPYRWEFVNPGGPQGDSLYDWSKGRTSTSPDSAGAVIILPSGSTVEAGDVVYDHIDKVDVTVPNPAAVAITSPADRPLGAILSDIGESHTVYQGVYTVPGPGQCTISWDMYYRNYAPDFVPGEQSLQVTIRDAWNNILMTPLETSPGDPLTNGGLVHYTADVSAFLGNTLFVRIDLEGKQDYFDVAFNNFEIKTWAERNELDVVLEEPRYDLVNGSFEQDYLGWKLRQSGATEPQPGGTSYILDGGLTVLPSGTTIASNDNAFWDFYQMRSRKADYWRSPYVGGGGAAPFTFWGTDGNKLAVKFANKNEDYRLAQDVTLLSDATTLSWDMYYRSSAAQEIPKVTLRDLDDNVLATLFEGDAGTPLSSGTMVTHEADISAFAGMTVRVSVDMELIGYVPGGWIYNSYAEVALDNFRLGSGVVWHWPADGAVRSIDELWVNLYGDPLRGYESVAVVYSADGVNWQAVQLNADGGTGHWYANIGSFAPGTEVEYALVAVDDSGNEHWYNNGGENFAAVVNSGSVQWGGNVSQWPVDGELGAGDELWINAESWPQGADTTAQLVYSLDGGASWQVQQMSLGSPAGNNDHWYTSLGSFASGQTIEYAIVFENVAGDDVWVNGDGSNYQAYVAP